MEKETLSHTWRRLPWCAEAEQALGHLIEAERAAILADVAAGLSFLFEVSGPDYGGFFLFRFYDNHQGQTVCYCIAFNGRNARAGLPHLAGIAAKAGAVELICKTEQEAVMRLYRRDGWRVAVYELVLDL